MKPVVPLTDSKLKSLKPREKMYRTFDGFGLVVETFPSGVKLWRLRYKKYNRSLGAWPGVTAIKPEGSTSNFGWRPWGCITLPRLLPQSSDQSGGQP